MVVFPKMYFSFESSSLHHEKIVGKKLNLKKIKFFPFENYFSKGVIKIVQKA